MHPNVRWLSTISSHGAQMYSLKSLHSLSISRVRGGAPTRHTLTIPPSSPMLPRCVGSAVRTMRGRSATSTPHRTVVRDRAPCGALCCLALRVPCCWTGLRASLYPCPHQPTLSLEGPHALVPCQLPRELQPSVASVGYWQPLSVAPRSIRTRSNIHPSASLRTLLVQAHTHTHTNHTQTRTHAYLLHYDTHL